MSNTRRLPVPLSEAERLAMALELSSAVDDARTKEKQKKDAMAKFTSQIDALYARIYELNEPVRTGVVERDVMIELRPDHFRKVIETWRMDTMDFVDERDMKTGETQLPIAATKEKKRKKADLKTEEEQKADSPEEAEEMRAKRLEDEKRQRARDLFLATAAGAVIVLPTLADEPDAFKASIGPHHGFPWTDIIESFGATEKEAADALVEKCAKIIIQAEAAAKVARQERILKAFGEAWARRTVTQNGVGWVAKIDGQSELAEVESADELEAIAGLRIKLLALLQAKESGPETEPKTLLKSPKKKRKAGDDGHAEPPSAPPPPPSDPNSPEPGLAF